ncbi:hypothetical protein Zmor_012415 [Zophobas morio]|jgi:hypothetical protein|uniref:Uncharacterized protein n=1 Tax=Zophobas morio TaxID=2755281 RepID=A0AA38HES6_9CUCU|nr:hypothetical protein Zmor_012415 [Zophobas morio]
MTDQERSMAHAGGLKVGVVDDSPSALHSKTLVMESTASQQTLRDTIRRTDAIVDMSPAKTASSGVCFLIHVQSSRTVMRSKAPTGREQARA